MSVEPEDMLALPVVAILGIVALMVVITANGGNAAWLGGVAQALAYPLTVIAIVGGLALAFYRELT